MSPIKKQREIPTFNFHQAFLFILSYKTFVCLFLSSQKSKISNSVFKNRSTIVYSYFTGKALSLQSLLLKRPHHLPQNKELFLKLKLLTLSLNSRAQLLRILASLCVFWKKKITMESSQFFFNSRLLNWVSQNTLKEIPASLLCGLEEHQLQTTKLFSR